MKKKIKKIFIAILCCILILGCFVNIVYGYNWNFEQFDKYSNIGTAKDKIETTGATIIKLMQVIGIGIAILMLVIFGITYMFTATTDKKVEMKKNMPNYIAGVIIIFSAVALLEIVSVFINGNINK